MNFANQILSVKLSAPESWQVIKWHDIIRVIWIIHSITYFVIKNKFAMEFQNISLATLANIRLGDWISKIQVNVPTHSWGSIVLRTLQSYWLQISDHTQFSPCVIQNGLINFCHLEIIFSRSLNFANFANFAKIAKTNTRENLKKAADLKLREN